MTNTVSRLRLTALAAIAMLSLTACGANETPDDTAEPTPSATEATAMEKWDDAYAFLSEQTDDLEILCSVVDVGSDGTPTDVPGVPRTFHSFDDRDSWEGDTLTRHELEPGSKNVAVCGANVPTHVAFETDAINEFLTSKGLFFSADGIVAMPGVDQIEIWYAGASDDDPDIQYTDTPGLWALYLSIRVLEGAVDDDHSIVPPADDAAAEEYLAAAAPALQWYGYKG